MARGALPRNRCKEPVSLEGGNCGNGGLAPRSFSYLCVAAASLVCSSAAKAASSSGSSMGARAGSLLASSAIAGGPLTGRGSNLPWLPIAALRRRWELWRPWLGVVHQTRCVCGVSRRLGDVWRGFQTGSRGDRFGWLPQKKQPEASDLQPAHSHPGDHQTATLSASHLQIVCKALHANLWSRQSCGRAVALVLA